MDRLIATIADVSDPRIGGGDSFCDRLNCRYTVFILSVFAVLVTTRHYVGEPISCWAPAHFTGAHVDYTNKVCWVTNNYYLPMDQDFPGKGEPRQMIGYYQWVGLLMICQAVFFYLPRPIWRLLSKKSGISVITITDAAIECQRKSDSESREKTLGYMVQHMGRFLKELSRKMMQEQRCKSCLWAIFGNYLCLMYLFVKMLYFVNVLGQLFLLNAFLGTGMNFHYYGIEVIERLVRGEPISVSERFPRVTFCDFEIRVLGNTHRYTVQCTLPVNLFNEKIYIFIWFWFVFVAFASFGSSVLWFFRMLFPSRQIRYIKTRLIAMDRLGKADKDLVRKFVRSYLQRDGVFIIWMTAKNSSDIIAAELICGLWEHYKHHRASIESLQRHVSDDPEKALTVARPGAMGDDQPLLVQRKGASAPLASDEADEPASMLGGCKIETAV